MRKRASLFIIGAALIVSAATVVSGAFHPAATQSSSSSSASSGTTSTRKKRSTSSKSRRRSRAHAQAAPTPDRIKEIQAALQKDGSYGGTPTGKWDAATTDAMRKFQDKNGFNPTGKIDAVSLNKLGLGSETAGKGAPVSAASARAPVAAAPKPGDASPVAAAPPEAHADPPAK